MGHLFGLVENLDGTPIPLSYADSLKRADLIDEGPR